MDILMQEKIIFLDIDGTILPESNHQFHDSVVLYKKLLKNAGELSHEELQKALREYNLNIPFSQHAIFFINRLCEKTGAKIVVHSNWKKYFSEEELQNKFIREGIDIKYFHEDFICYPRGFTSQKIHDLLNWITCREEETGCKIKGIVFDNHHIYQSYQFPEDDIIQVIVDEYDGIKTNNYRIAAGFFGLEDSKFNVYPVENNLIPDILELFRFEGEKAYKYLYAQNYSHLQARGNYINKKFLKNIYKNSKFYTDLSFDEYFKQEKNDFFENLKLYLKNKKV